MFPALSALSVVATAKVTRLGMVAEQFLLVDGYSEIRCHQHRRRAHRPSASGRAFSGGLT